MNIFSWLTFEKSLVKSFSGSLGILYWSKTCSDRSGLSIAPTLDRFGVVRKKKDTIEKGMNDDCTNSPFKKKRTDAEKGTVLALNQDNKHNFEFKFLLHV